MKVDSEDRKHDCHHIKVDDALLDFWVELGEILNALIVRAAVSKSIEDSK
jgi:hypothetical protein